MSVLSPKYFISELRLTCSKAFLSLRDCLQTRTVDTPALSLSKGALSNLPTTKEPFVEGSPPYEGGVRRGFA
jgi:hypothetical protein